VVSNKLTKIDGIIGPNGEKMDEKLNTSEFKQTADSFSLCTTTYASGQASDAERNAKNAAQGYANTAENNAKEHADDVGDDIKTRLYQTGILIDGNNRKIELQADHTVFKSSAGDNAKIWLDATDGSLHAVDGNFSGTITSTNGMISSFIIKEHELYGYNGSIYLEGGTANNTYQLTSRGASDLRGLKLSGSPYADFGIISDSDSSSYIDKVHWQGSLIIATGAVVLPSWPPAGWVFFMKVCRDTTVSVANPSRMRIYRASGDVVTSMDADYRSLIFIKLGNMSFGGSTFDTWCEFYCG